MSDKLDGELFRRLAALERRVNKLEYSMHEFDTVIDPQGWIGEAFEKQEEYLDGKFAEIDRRFDSIDAKLNAILERLTGVNNSE